MERLCCHGVVCRSAAHSRMSKTKANVSSDDEQLAIAGRHRCHQMTRPCRPPVVYLTSRANTRELDIFFEKTDCQIIPLKTIFRGSVHLKPKTNPRHSSLNNSLMSMDLPPPPPHLSFVDNSPHINTSPGLSPCLEGRTRAPPASTASKRGPKPINVFSP
jgi:hypothetical protein